MSATTARHEISSIDVVPQLPELKISLRKTDGGGAPTIHVDGMPIAMASEIPWGKIIDLIGDLVLGGGGKNGGGGGGGGGGCTTIKITNADGSSTEIKQCPPPKTT